MPRLPLAGLLTAGLLLFLSGPTVALGQHLDYIHNLPSKCPCPPPYLWFSEGPPWIKFKKACPRPVCDPCNLEHYGYYQTC